MVQGDYYREEKPRVEVEYDPDTDPNYEESRARRLAQQIAASPVMQPLELSNGPKTKKRRSPAYYRNQAKRQFHKNQRRHRNRPNS